MKIAVCLSGQPRSIEYAINSILNFFNVDYAEVDFFCHVWDYNTWKLKNNKEILFGEYEPVDRCWLEEQVQRLNPKKFKISPYSTIYPDHKYLPWGSLFYSLLNANLLKLQYEVENNFRYDLVVKSRYDVVFSPFLKFRTPYTIDERHLYFPHAGRMPQRYNYINASDPFFYGDSWGMDIVADSFTLIKQNFQNPYSHRLDQVSFHDPGTFITTVCNRFNIIVDVGTLNPGDIIYRKEASGLDCVNDFDEILRIHSSYYE